VTAQGGLNGRKEKNNAIEEIDQEAEEGQVSQANQAAFGQDKIQRILADWRLATTGVNRKQKHNGSEEKFKGFEEGSVSEAHQAACHASQTSRRLAARYYGCQTK
jgi:hypothetical protein